MCNAVVEKWVLLAIIDIGHSNFVENGTFAKIVGVDI